MLGRIFGNHSEVNTFGELHFFENLLDTSTIDKNNVWPKEKLITLLERLLTSAHDGLFSHVTHDKFKAKAEQIILENNITNPIHAYRGFLEVETNGRGKSISCEQTPRYLFAANEILELFPDCYIINMIRDPRDVMLSQKNKWRRRFLGGKNIPLFEAIRSWVNYHPYTISRLWVSAVTTANKLERNCRFKTIYFEELLEKPEHIIRELCEFTNIEFEENMLSVPQVGSSAGKDLSDKIGVDKSKAGGWRKGGLSKVELAVCQQVAQQEMKRLGYDVEQVTISFFSKTISMLVFTIKISMALILNIRRNKNIVQTIKRRLNFPAKGK